MRFSDILRYNFQAKIIINFTAEKICRTGIYKERLDEQKE
jgi:hypothetical protein